MYIEKNTLSDLAYLELKKSLLSGKFAPGHRIILRDVAAEFGISLTPVRDAVNHLIAERVLERGPGGQKGGATVPELDSDEFVQLTLLRTDLEARLAHAATLNIGASGIEELESLVEQMAQSRQDANSKSYLHLHRTFHFSLYNHAKMNVVNEITETLWLRCGPALNAVLKDYVPKLKQRDYHREAVEFLKARNADEVANSIRQDITEAGAYIFDELKKHQACAAKKMVMGHTSDERTVPHP